MWVLLLLVAWTNAISYNKHKQIILYDEEGCNGAECPFALYQSLTYFDDSQDSLQFRQPLKSKLFKRCPFWSSGNSGNNNGSNEPLDKTKVANHYRHKQVLTIRKVDVEQEVEYSNKFQVTALPTLIFIAKGQIYCRVRGVISPDQAIEIIDKIIEKL